MVKSRQVVRAIFFALLLTIFSAASASLAYGQFTLSVFSPPSPPFVDPGQKSIAELDLEPNPSTDPITLTCVVTTQIPQPVSLPTCDPSPTSPITPPAKPSLTIGTFATTSFGLYNIAVTGTSSTNSTQTITLTLNVVNVVEDYTLSVAPTTATPSSVHAGQQATTTVTVTPIANYSGNITLACLSISPAVAPSPVCSFNPPAVAVTSGGIPPTSILTITTTGPATGSLWGPRVFYALWLAVPGLALVGVGAGGVRRKNALGTLLLMAVACGLLLLPACNATKSTTSSTSGVTPNNTYTFTLTGADQNGAAPANTICTSGVNCGATVTLTVD
jgi:hypothetical protein